MVANFQIADAGTDFLNDRAAFVAEDCRKNSFRVFARQRECIRVTDTRCDVSQQNFALFRSVKFDFFNFERFACFPGDSGTILKFCSQYRW